MRSGYFWTSPQRQTIGPLSVQEAQNLDIAHCEGEQKMVVCEKAGKNCTTTQTTPVFPTSRGADENDDFATS